MVSLINTWINTYIKLKSLSAQCRQVQLQVNMHVWSYETGVVSGFFNKKFISSRYTFYHNSLSPHIGFSLSLYFDMFFSPSTNVVFLIYFFYSQQRCLIYFSVILSVHVLVLQISHFVLLHSNTVVNLFIFTHWGHTHIQEENKSFHICQLKKYKKIKSIT